MHIHKFRKLTVWQRSIQFVSLIYQVTSKFPKEEKYGLVDQVSAMITGLIKSLKGVNKSVS